MPFDFKKYDLKCTQMNPEQLQKEWEHYTRLISGAATSTTVSGLALPFTAGISVIGVGMAAPAIHNARKKREIIEKHLKNHSTTHNTRAKDVLGSMAFSGTLGVLTLGVGTMGAEQLAQVGAEQGISAIVANDTAIKIGIHAALDGAAMAGEEAHHNHKKEKEANKMIAAAKQKIALAQAQGQQYLPRGEKVYGNQLFPSETAYGIVQIPGTYNSVQTQKVASPPSSVQYLEYTMPVAAEVKYDMLPTPQYTPAPPAYYGLPGMTSPPPKFQTPAPQYSLQTCYPSPTQTPSLTSPTPSISAVSSQSSHPSQVFTPASSVAKTPAPQHIPSNQPQVAAHFLPPFRSQVAAPGFQAPQAQLTWSHVHNQWISHPVAPVQPVSATIQQAQAQTPAPQEGYPFPPQPTDRTASMYASAPTHYAQPSPALQQYAMQPQANTSSPLVQQPYTPPAPTTNYSSPPSQTTFAYGQPTPGQTPDTSQQFTETTPYFPPQPSGAQRAQSYSSTSSHHQQPGPQYALVSMPQPYLALHRNSLSQHSQPALMTPPPEQPFSQYAQYQQLAPRHYSLPNPALSLGQEKLGSAGQPNVQYNAIHEQL